MLSWLSEDEMLILQILPDQSTDAKAKSRQGGGYTKGVAVAAWMGSIIRRLKATPNQSLFWVLGCVQKWPLNNRSDTHYTDFSHFGQWILDTANSQANKISQTANLYSF